MKTFLLASTAMLATVFIENASANAFKGAYIGAQTGIITNTTKSNVTNEKATNIANSAGTTSNSSKNRNGLGYGVFGGYGTILHDHYYVGAEASILSDNVNRKTNQNATDSGNNASYVNSIDYQRRIALGIAPRLGYIFGNNMLYAKPGIEISKDKATAVIAAAPAAGGATQSTTITQNKRNIVLAPAVGYEKALGSILLRTEYTYNHGKKIGLNSNSSPVTASTNVSYTDHRFAVGAAYKF